MGSQLRPILKIKLTKSDMIIEIISVLILATFWFSTFFQYNSLPEIIPTHFNGDGSANGNGPKYMIFGLPIISLLFYIGLTYVSRFPEKFNYMTEITTQNAVKQYSIATQMLRVMKLCIIIMFFAVEYKTVQDALNGKSDLGGWFMFCIVSLIFIPLFYFLVQFSKNS